MLKANTNLILSFCFIFCVSSGVAAVTVIFNDTQKQKNLEFLRAQDNLDLYHNEKQANIEKKHHLEKELNSMNDWAPANRRQIENLKLEIATLDEKNEALSLFASQARSKMSELKNQTHRAFQIFAQGAKNQP